MTNEQYKRAQLALQESVARLVKIEKQKTFDQYQEADKQKEIKFLSGHIMKLSEMVVA